MARVSCFPLASRRHGAACEGGGEGEFGRHPDHRQLLSEPGGDFVELDAIEANTLRGLLEVEIEAILPDDWLSGVKAAEKSEREILANWAAAVGLELRP